MISKLNMIFSRNQCPLNMNLVLNPITSIT
jgi:hypothetical protein